VKDPENRDCSAVVDTRGLYCPVPILRTRDRIRSMSSGDVLEVVSDDPAILEDMPAFCRSHGHEYLGHAEGPEGVWRVRLRLSEGTVGR
jgi:tRNA 2-thiouridine synthesizing protein A